MNIDTLFSYLSISWTLGLIFSIGCFIFLMINLFVHHTGKLHGSEYKEMRDQLLGLLLGLVAPIAPFILIGICIYVVYKNIDE